MDKGKYLKGIPPLLVRFGDNTSVHVLRGFQRMATENIVFIYTDE